MKSYKKYIENLSQVKLKYFNESINCQILKESDDLILVRDIKDWHYDAYMIFPKKYIKKIIYGKIEKCREKILPPIKREDFLNGIEKINLTSIKDALYSLKELIKCVCIENAQENNYIFVLGKIKKLKTKKLVLQEINLCGYYEPKVTKIKYNNITSIFFDDEYSKKLIEFAEKQA